MKVQRLSQDYRKEIGKRIKVIRTILEYDQKQLAEYLNTAASQLSKIEAGKAEPGIYHLLMIKRLFDSQDSSQGKLNWSWLIEGKGPGPL